MKQRKLKSEFAQLVNLRCSERGINQKNLAEQMGISLNYLSLLKSGKRGKRTPTDKLVHYAKVLTILPSHLERLLNPTGQQISSPPPPEAQSNLAFAQKLLDQLTLEIAARKTAEEQLQASEQRYRSIVESMTDMVLRFTTSALDLSDASIIYVNEAFCRIVHLPIDQILGANPLDSIDESHQYLFQKAFAGLSIQNPHQTFDGKGKWTERWRRFTISQVNKDEFQMLAHDIHEFKELEKRLAEMEKRDRQ